MNTKVYVAPPDSTGTGAYAVSTFCTASGGIDDCLTFLDMTGSLGWFDLKNQIIANTATFAAAHTYTITSTDWWVPDNATVSLAGLMSSADKVLLNSLSSSTSASYQTIVSQTTTGAPAVSGGFTPVNTLAGTPTMTWARTGAGVYTLTAGSAVFSTTGKTGVFVAPLTNLNGSVRAVVTSSTVITVTTAVQSLAVLGLLGFTATATDTLLDKTMIFIQNYA